MSGLCVDLYCGLGGWAEGFLAEQFTVVGFDIECHDYGTGGYPGHLVIQDVRTLHGSQFKNAQFKNASVIVASPPCTEPSYRAMPWKKAKALNAIGPPHKFIELFEACFRIQREACEASDRYIPLIVENVKGAQPWVGRARWHFGSYYLWGDVPALMPIARSTKISGQDWNRFKQTGEVSPHWRMEGLKNPAETRDEKYRFTTPIKNNGGSWFAVAHNKASGTGQNPDGRKLPAGNCSPRRWEDRSVARLGDATKCGGSWFGAGNDCSLMRQHSSRSRSRSRKAASAHIAKIPFPLARHIAQCFKQVRP